MPHDPYKALYIHIPYCKSKCAYCDFTSFVNSSETEVSNYFNNLVEQIRALSAEGELAEIETVYIGGGTPSFTGSKNLTQLLYALNISMHFDGVECTIEANPESLNERLLADVWALGANRLSIGVQSFDDDLLLTLGRAHNASQAIKAIEVAKKRFSNISIDLMCGLPGQDMSMFEKSIDKAIELELNHISVYPLSVEAGTIFAKKMDRNELHLPTDEYIAGMMKLAATKLEYAGLFRYEVASYARPGFECKHNISYWSGVPYVGIGLSAATMTQNEHRRMRVVDGKVADDLNSKEMLAEDFMLAMRMSRGLSVDQITKAANTLPKVINVFDNLAKKGLIELVDGSYKPTELGWLLGNELYGEILDLSN